MREVMTELKPNQPLILDNCSCVYCGESLDLDKLTKEHVIGRRFVPKGTLNGHWNLIVQACQSCNNIKSDLENDISAITMQPDVTGRHVHENESVALIADRKAENAISRRTKKPVKDSQEQMSLGGSLSSNVTMSFGLVGPPGIDEDRAFLLARLQLTAFFFWITYDSSTRRGGYWQDGFQPVMMVRHEDWGNERMVGFAATVRSWRPRIRACTAEGFFKLVVRRHPTAECWSWAIEWNQTTRLIGFFGDQSVAESIIGQLPKPTMKTVGRGPNVTVRMRTEMAIDPADDLLFAFDD